jgi:hypothetical protein
VYGIGWHNLAQVLLAHMILFNRCRSGEVGRMKVSDYRKATERMAQVQDDVTRNLTSFEKNLCASFT